MNQSDMINLSLEQTVESFGDPTPAVFDVMYQRFPALEQFKSADNEWENYMMQEILTNFMQFAEDPKGALATIRDMFSHHQLIGVPVEIFKGMYQTLFDVLSPIFSGPHKAEMVSAWEQNLQLINRCIEECEERCY